MEAQPFRLINYKTKLERELKHWAKAVITGKIEDIKFNGRGLKHIDGLRGLTTVN